MCDGKTLENFEQHNDVNLLTFCRTDVAVLLGNDSTEARVEKGTSVRLLQAIPRIC